MWRLFGPKRTPLSVIKELVEGFDNGTVVFPWPEEKPTVTEEASFTLDVAPIADGPFLYYPSTTFGSMRAHKRRNPGGAIRVSRPLVDSESAGAVPRYAPV